MTADMHAMLAALLAYPPPPEHADKVARGVLRQHAQQLAEKIRTHYGVAGAPVKAHCDPDCDFCIGVTGAADLIDPTGDPT